MVESHRDFKSDVIIFDYYKTPQSYLMNLLGRYPKMRDYHNDPPSYAAMFIGCNIIADTLNATLLARPHAEKAGRNLEECPLINPAVQLYDAEGMSVEMFWKKHRFSENRIESANFVQLIFLGYNFGYGDFPSIKLEKSWNIKIITSAFDSYIWFNLLLSIILIALVLHSSAIYWNKGTETSFSLILHSVKLALASIGPTFGESSTIFKKSKLFVLWTLTCIVIANYFSGAITSLLISPPKEDTMTKLSDVVNRNYSPIFDDFYYIQIVNDTVTKYSSNGNSLGLLSDIKHMKIIMDRTRNDSLISNRTEFVRMLAYAKKIVFFYMWPYVIRAIDETNRLIAEEEPVACKRRHCYIGKHVVDVGQVYFGIGPPGSERLKHVFQVMIQTGL
ncbi:unnamed protein product [Orchesella dallaii]|uniref:Ionotropic glutamate receptor C-terminal domain-containing protein n=1 Tax=Orchesella dallaii TaxID=48710 RepID=A0ABP1Q341_9HEXA